MPPDNVEGEVAAHVFSVVCQRCNEAFVGWALTVPRGGKLLVGESFTDVGDGSHSCGEEPCGGSKRGHLFLLSQCNHELG